MFGRHLEVKVVKDTKDSMVDVTPSVSAEDIERIAKKVVKYVAIGAASTLALMVTLNTASEITVNRFSNSKNEN